MIIAPPYVKEVTEKVAILLKPCNVKMYNRIPNKLKNYVCKLKDQRKQNAKKNVVYTVKIAKLYIVERAEEQRNRG